MIQCEYIIDKDKALFTLIFNRNVSKILKVKCDEYLNFYQSAHNIDLLTIFKADTGYRVIRHARSKKTYKIIVRQQLNSIQEFSLKECSYFIKPNGIIKIHLGMNK